MSLTRPEHFYLPPELTELMLTFLTEQEVLWFAQTSKAHTTIAHRVLLTRGMSRGPWRKLLAAATREPDLIPLPDMLASQQTHQPRDNIFDEAARALFLLAKNNKQLVVSNQWIYILISAYKIRYASFAISETAANILSLLTPSMTDIQFKKVFTELLPQFNHLSNWGHFPHLLEFMSLRLSIEQLTEYAQGKNILDVMDMVMSADRAACVFNETLLPTLVENDPRDDTSPMLLLGHLRRHAAFLKLYPYLSPTSQAAAVTYIQSALQANNIPVVKSAHQLMQKIAPTQLNEEVLAGVKILESHLQMRKTGQPLKKEWQEVFAVFGIMSSSLTAQHLEGILPLMADLFTTWPGPTYDKDNFERHGLTLLSDLASCMSDDQASTMLTVVEKIPLVSLSAREQLLKRVSVDRRRLSIPSAITEYERSNPISMDERYVRILIVLANDMSEEETYSLFPMTFAHLLCLREHKSSHDVLYDLTGNLEEAIQDLLTALIPRLSTDSLLSRWINRFKDEDPTLLLQCLSLRMQDLKDDLLMGFMPQIIECLGGQDASLSKIAQEIIVSFTSKPNIHLPNDIVFLIHETLNSSKTIACYNVWCHLMTLGKYDLHTLNAAIAQNKDTGLDQLIHLIEAASSDQPTAPPLAPQTPSSISIVNSSHSFFHIIPRQPQPSPPDASIARPQ